MAVNVLVVALFMLTVADCDGCANRFPLFEISVAKVVLNSIFKLPKVGIFGG